jgi:type II pantothenate kinase
MGEAMDCRGVDLSGAEIRGDLEGRNPPIFLPRQPAASPLVALDIGGTFLRAPLSLDFALVSF